VFGIALGYEDLNDHDDLRHDPAMAVLAGKLDIYDGAASARMHRKGLFLTAFHADVVFCLACFSSVILLARL
jgi:hypothetical protein